MADKSQAWVLTLYFLDATGKKEVSNKLKFASSEAAEKALTLFIDDGDNRTGKIFRISNDDGEYIEFRGQHWRRHTVTRDALPFAVARNT